MNLKRGIVREGDDTGDKNCGSKVRRISTDISAATLVRSMEISQRCTREAKNITHREALLVIEYHHSPYLIELREEEYLGWEDTVSAHC